MPIINHYVKRYPLEQFIIYACPVGELNSQIENYLQKSRELYRENAAHQYMPHCTLTGFFAASLNSIPVYIEALNTAYIEAKNNNLSLKIEIKQSTFNQNWYGLELQSKELKILIANFARSPILPSDREQFRLKDWLHLSLAYDFNPQHGKQLRKLATAIINLNANVDWELRFYQKNPDWTWKCLQSWTLP